MRISLELERTESFSREEELNPTMMKRATPQIGGSSGGFIALVVCLVMIIVVSCSAIFYLLKHNNPTDAERATRRQRRYAHQSVPSSSSYTYDPSSTPSKGWFSKVTNIFNRKSGQPSTSSKSRKNGKRGDGLKMKLGSSSTGWVQAGSGDEWDSEMSGDEVHGRRDMTTTGPSPLATPNPYARGIDSPFIPPRESISSAYLDSHPPNGPASYGQRSDSPPSLPPGAQSPLSPVVIGDVSPFPTSTISHERTFSPEPMSAAPVESPHPHNKNRDSLEAVDTRKWSVQSDVSARTSATGTKFIEEL